MSPESREPILVADAGPLIRLAAAGLLDTLRGLNRRIVIVDRVAEEVCGDLTKPYAEEVARWIASMGGAVHQATTAIGAGIAALKLRERNAEEEAALKAALRNSGELAVREFVDRWMPTEGGAALVIYEDRKVPHLFIDAEFPVTLMTTRAFVATVSAWGINVDAVAMLERISDLYDLKPALTAEFDPEQPADLRQLPQAPKEKP